MDTKLFHSVIFGPIKSRRLGTSLGINLLPAESKFCNFDCLYCECGWTVDMENTGKNLPQPYTVVEELVKEIQLTLEQGKRIDHITFAGNGEPTLHPDFDKIISDVVLVRNLMCPDTKISVLSNGTTFYKKQITKTLVKADQFIVKLNAGTEALFQKVNRPLGKISIQQIKQYLKNFKGNITIQTLFFKGQFEGAEIDNTTPEELNAWLSHIIEINPKQVMIYSIDRPTPASKLKAISKTKLNAIAHLLKPYKIDVLVV